MHEKVPFFTYMTTYDCTKGSHIFVIHYVVGMAHLSVGQPEFFFFFFLYLQAVWVIFLKEEHNNTSCLILCNVR